MNKPGNRKNLILSVIVAILVWQLVAVLVPQKILLVGPFEVLLRLFTIWREDGFVAAILTTMFHITGGFLLGYIFGILLAVLAYKWKLVEQFLWPWVAMIKSVPVASFVVICLIWLSTRKLSVFISFLIVFPITYQNVLSALRSINRELIDLAHMENIGYFKRVKEIYLPQISKALVSTASLTAGMSWKAGIAAEIIGTPSPSIGKELYLSKIYLDTDDLLAWTVIIVILSQIFEKIVVLLIGRLLPSEE